MGFLITRPSIDVVDPNASPTIASHIANNLIAILYQYSVSRCRIFDRQPWSSVHTIVR